MTEHLFEYLNPCNLQVSACFGALKVLPKCSYSAPMMLTWRFFEGYIRETGRSDACILVDFVWSITHAISLCKLLSFKGGIVVV